MTDARLPGVYYPHCDRCGSPEVVWLMRWSYGNGSTIRRYFCADHEPHPKRAAKIRLDR